MINKLAALGAELDIVARSACPGLAEDFVYANYETSFLRVAASGPISQVAPVIQAAAGECELTKALLVILHTHGDLLAERDPMAVRQAFMALGKADKLTSTYGEWTDAPPSELLREND